MDFLAVLKSVIQTLSANYIWESHGLFVWWCLFFPWIPLHHFHYHKQCCNGKAVADLIKKLSNNVKNPLEIQAPEWRGLMTARELSLQSTTPVGCVWALVVWCGVLQNHLLPLCAVAGPKDRKHEHLWGRHRAVSCVCPCAQRDMAGWGWLLSGPCHVCSLFPASGSAVLWMEPAREAALPALSTAAFDTHWKLSLGHWQKILCDLYCVLMFWTKIFTAVFSSWLCKLC